MSKEQEERDECIRNARAAYKAGEIDYAEFMHLLRIWADVGSTDVPLQGLGSYDKTKRGESVAAQPLVRRLKHVHFAQRRLSRGQR
jgi:hypothetical protein